MSPGQNALAMVQSRERPPDCYPNSLLKPSLLIDDKAFSLENAAIGFGRWKESEFKREVFD